MRKEIEGRPPRPIQGAYQDLRRGGNGYRKVPPALRVNCAANFPWGIEALARGRYVVQRSDMQSVSERSETRSSTEVFAGVPLMQLAAVAAARAEGFPLEEILNAEGLEAASYRAADVSYKRKLVDPAEREVLCANYQNELAQAEDRLARKVSPIDEDIDAWVRFLGTYGNQSAPADWLLAMGLTLPDLSRLSRAWKRRLDADDALCKRAEKSARDKKPYEVSSLRISPAKLVPSPLAKPIKKQPLGDTAPLATQSSSPVNRWIPRAEPTVEPETPLITPQNLGIAFDFPIKPPAASPLAMTTPVFSLPAENILPFVPGPDLPDEAPTLEVEAAALAPPREALSGTSLAVDIPRVFITPFVATGSSTSVPEKPNELPKVKPAPAALGGTSLAVDIPRGPVTPFVQTAESPTIEAKQIGSKMPEVKPAPTALGGTSLAVDIPRGPVVPFAAGKGASSIDEKSIVPVVPEKAVVKQAPAELSGTSFSLDIPRGPVTPFVAANDAPAKESTANPIALASKRAPVQEDKPQPKLLLSLEQHAALTVEIATYPAHALAILKRYGVTPPQKVDLDQHYKRIVATDPTQQAAWHAAYGAHYAALMRRR